jgi:hypothetical protein
VTDGPRSAIIIVSLALLRLHVSVDRIGDGRIGAACFVLVKSGACGAAAPASAAGSALGAPARRTPGHTRSTH